MISMQRHVNIPVFIPNLGCPHKCVFCDQREISGARFDISSVRRTISEALATVEEDADCEIAFFGGSFTGIGIPLMTSLLDIAREFTDAGRVGSIRLSTRPDMIDDGILDSFDIISIITEVSSEFDVQIPANEIVPENFNSAEALWKLIERLEDE